MGVFSREECLHRLGGAKIGRVAFIDSGEPVILPVNHGLDGESVVFLTAPGLKLLAADNEVPVAFEIDGYDPDRQTGWSVLISGTAASVEEEAEVARLNLAYPTSSALTAHLPERGRPGRRPPSYRRRPKPLLHHPRRSPIDDR
jgi:nitroimidazol reductase NimA-like FMN-containing flavoprotein (pyridoxamine 5'-phosphate oxidase superfamily)